MDVVLTLRQSVTCDGLRKSHGHFANEVPLRAVYTKPQEVARRRHTVRTASALLPLPEHKMSKESGVEPFRDVFSRASSVMCLAVPGII